MYSTDEYTEAINFALNYPPEIDRVEYDQENDVFRVLVLDGGWYDMFLYGSFIRSCLNWKGKKSWNN